MDGSIWKIFCLFVAKIYLFRQLGAFAVITATWKVYCLLSNCWNRTSCKLSSYKNMIQKFKFSNFLFLICILYGRVLRDKDCLNDKYDLVYRQSFNVSSELCGGRFQKVERTWVLHCNNYIYWVIFIQFGS